VEIRELILRLNREKGITFLISSHILTELQLVATKYGIISKGKIIREITEEQLHQECARNTVIRADKPAELEALMRSLLPDHPIIPVADGVKITGEVNMNGLFAAIIDANIQILTVNCTESSFEDYYLNLIGGGRNG
jgi:ABC-2 type transport system ATP-binding protein